MEEMTPDDRSVFVREGPTTVISGILLYIRVVSLHSAVHGKHLIALCFFACLKLLPSPF